MTPEEFMAEAERRLAANKYTVEQLPLPGAPAVVGRRKPFRVRWFLTQLKTSVVVTAVDTVTAEGWMRFTHDAFQAAKAFKGGLPTGFQAGIGAIPILAANNLDPAAIALAVQRPQVEWFTGVALPALVDLTSGQVYQNAERVLVGGIYFPFLRKQSQIVTSIVGGNVNASRAG